MHTQHSPRLFLSTLVLGAALGLACGGSGSPGQDETTLSDALGSAEGVQAQEDQGGKVAVCHIPPGNPANAHTIHVGGPAVPAHLRHGDTLGACAPGDATAPDAGTGDGSTGGDAGTDGGTDACVPQGGACGGDVGTCCDGLSCTGGVCGPIIG